MIFVALMIVGSIGCGSSSPPVSDLVAKQDGQHVVLGPRLVIEPVDFVLSSAEVISGHAERKFTITNDGDAPLHIKEVVTSCGCTVADLDQVWVEPSKSSQLVIRVKANRWQANQVAVSLRSNDKERFERIVHIRWDVDEPLQIIPTVLHFPPVGVNQLSERTFSLEWFGGDPVGPHLVERVDLRCENAPENVDVRIEPVKDSEYRAIVLSHGPIGDFQADLVVYLDEQPVARSNAKIAIRSDAWSTPKTLSVYADRQESVTRRVFLHSLSGDPLAVQSVRCQPDLCLTRFSLSSIQGQPALDLELRMTEDHEFQQALITIESKVDGRIHEIVIPVTLIRTGDIDDFGDVS